MKKILLFGNGVSLRYAENEYTYESIRKKALEGLETTVNLYKGNLLPVEGYVNRSLEMLEQETFFNEATFFEIWKIITIGKLNQIDISPWSFENGEEIFEKFYNSIRDNHNLGSSFDKNIVNVFKEAKQDMDYMLQRALSINLENDSFIDIRYSDEFIKKVKTYCLVTTTNYYVGDLSKDVRHLHGKVNVDKNFVFSPGEFTRKNTIGNEFSNDNSQILFGKNYEEKIFLNSMISIQSDVVKRKEIIGEGSLDFLKEDYEIDIFGLSVEGDKTLIKNIINSAKKCVIFWHTEKDQKEWKEIIKNNQNCVLKKDTEFINKGQ